MSNSPSPHAVSPAGLQRDEIGVWLDRQVWRTKGARFEAFRRLSAAHRSSLVTISFLSTYSIVAALFPAFVSLPDDHLQLLSIAVVAFSLFILVLSLIEAGQNYQRRADTLHHCGLELGALYDRFRIAAQSSDWNEVRADGIVDEYHRILRMYDENHLPVDDARFRTLHPVEFPMSNAHRWWILTRHWCRTYFFYLALIVAPIVMFLAMVLS